MPGDGVNGWRTRSRCPAIAALQEEVPGGRCVFCERQIRPGSRREQYKCFRADCTTAYNTEVVRYRRQQVAAQGFTQRGTRPKLNRRWEGYYRGEKEPPAGQGEGDG